MKGMVGKGIDLTNFGNEWSVGIKAKGTVRKPFILVDKVVSHGIKD